MRICVLYLTNKDPTYYHVESVGVTHETYVLRLYSGEDIVFAAAVVRQIIIIKFGWTAGAVDKT